MTTTLRLKRRISTGLAGAPASLATTEPAYNEADDTLYLGYGDTGGGIATSIRAVAGSGAFVDKSSTQTIAGTKTFSTTPVVGTLVGTDNSTSAASTAFVKDQGYLLANQSITLSGDTTGTGTTAITTTLANTGITGGTYTKITVDTKGRATAGTTLIASDIPTLTAAKISDFDTQVRTNRLDQLAAPTASVSLNSQKITNLLTPTLATDAATMGYVDSVAQGLDVKGSVVAATTANITLSAAQTIDGIALVAGNRVLVKNQSTPAQNGIYLVAAGAWTRTTDADAWGELPSSFLFVENGTVNANTGWVCTSTAGGTLGTTAVTFAQFSGAGTYVAGAGLTLTGTTFDVVGTANRITVAADSVDISTAYVGQATITTLGTVTTGTWNATAIAATRGGTGQTAYVVGDTLYASSTTALSKLTIGATGAVLTVAGGIPSWSTTIDGGTF